MMRIFAASLVTWIMFSSGPSFALETTSLSADVGGETIPVYLYMPDGAGPFPLVVLSHGSPRNGASRANYGADTLRPEASALAAEGVAVAVPIRRGYGASGHWAEAYGGCSEGRYYVAGLATAADIRAAIAAARKSPKIDGRRVALIGLSAGGFGSVAAGAGGGGLGIVNFAGGRGSSGPDKVCREDNLIEAMRRYGASSRAPELWIYSANDHFFGPDLARRMFEAFNGSGGRARFVEAPAYGGDGHQYFDDTAAWMPEVMAFLREIGVVQ